MSKENSKATPRRLEQVVMDFFFPYSRNNRLKAEAERAELAERAEQAKIELELESSYSNLGDEKGENVTEEQIRNVLKAELAVAQTTSADNSQDFPFVEYNIQDALELHTINGLNKAEIIMFKKTDIWRGTAHKSNYPEITKEARRRVVACENARRLLSSIKLRV